MKAEHTPLPWRNPKGSVSILTGTCPHPKQRKIADMSSSVSNVAEQEANAEFIVRAANSFEDLLEACKDATTGELGWQERCMAAIAKAEEAPRPTAP